MKVREHSETGEKGALAGALEAFDRGARILEQAYRELWAARETERAERELAAAEKIRDLCHEIRNPLGGVRGLAALLKRELEQDAASEKAHRLLEGILRGLEAVDSVLECRSRREEGRVDAGAVAEETAGLALAENRASGGDVGFRVEAPEGVEVPLPISKLRRILSNLVRNAAQACGQHGRVTLRIRSDPHELLLEVEDDGCGLPPVPDEELVRRGFSTKGPGRGRGLPLTRQLVEEAGGHLSFRRLAQGTLVQVRLPRG